MLDHLQQYKGPNNELYETYNQTFSSAHAPPAGHNVNWRMSRMLVCRVTWGASEFCRRNGRPSWRLSSYAPCLMMAFPSTSSKTCLCWPPVLKTGRTQCFMESLHPNGNNLHLFDYKLIIFFFCTILLVWSYNTLKLYTFFRIVYRLSRWTRSLFLPKVQRCIWKLCSVLLHYGPGSKGI